MPRWRYLKDIVKMHLGSQLPHRTDNLRIGRRSTPGATYAVVKNTADLYRPIIPDPLWRNWIAQECMIISRSIRWLTESGHWDPLIYVIMPDHLHIIFKLGIVTTLDDVMASFGKYTGRQINTLNGWTGPFWQHYYYDRMIRSDTELRNQITYIRQNPIKKGYVTRFEDWPYGMHHRKGDLPIAPLISRSPP